MSDKTNVVSYDQAVKMASLMRSNRVPVDADGKLHFDPIAKKFIESGDEGVSDIPFDETSQYAECFDSGHNLDDLMKIIMSSAHEMIPKSHRGKIRYKLWQVSDTTWGGTWDYADNHPALRG